MNLHQDDLKKRINRITATWRNGCFENMDDHTTPKHPPSKTDVLPKTFLQFKPAATTFAFPSVFILIL